MILDHTPIPITGFKGLYDRSAHKDDVRDGHFIDSLNTINYGEDVGTRKGFTRSITIGNILREHIWKIDGQADRILILNDVGQIFDTTLSLSTPILTVVSTTRDFAIIPMYGRLYISPHNGETGQASEKLYVYKGSGLARAAAGLKPTHGSDAVVSATMGDIEEGVHIFAWCYETDTGFITPPSDKDDFNQLDFDGEHAVDFTNIPVGPTGTVARRLLATRALQHPILDIEGYEYFFVPGGRIEDNVTTVLSGVSFFDSELSDTADYLFEQLEEIPAGVFLSPYGTRICMGGENSDPSLVRVSKPLEPESFNELSGFIVVDPHEEEGVKNGIEFRDSFYIFKGNPGHTYVTRDNGFEPSTWACPIVDKGIGADCRGVSQYLDSKGANADFFLVADVAGIFRFDGSYNQQVPLTWGIQRIWNRINKALFNQVELLLDPKRFLIYALVPLNTIDDTGTIITTASAPNYILVGDYSLGLWPDKIRWHIWNSAEFSPRSMVIEINSSTKATKLRVAGQSNVYDYDETQFNDQGQGINTYIQFEQVKLRDNFVHHYGGIGLNVKGNGTLVVGVYSTNLIENSQAPPITLSTSPNREYFRPTNLNNEKGSVRLSINQANSYFLLNKINVYTNVIFATRPG
jgi:hypothetical protein